MSEQLAQTGHTECAEFLRRKANSPTNPLADLPGSLVVADTRPGVVVPEFPPMHCRCPHGVSFWTYPDGALVAALRNLNYPPRGESNVQ